MSTPLPLEALRAVTTSGRSGEFICATPALEVHVYLQRGRVAWATDSSHPFEFARYIKEHCRVDDEAFRAAVDECRRNRLPLGETLVAWALVSWEQVRAALAHQLVLALQTLATGAGSTMFLDREWAADYDERLTFELSALLATQEPPAPDLEPRAPEAAPEPTALQLREEVHGAAWVDVLEAGVVVDAAPTAALGPRVPEALARASLGSGADFVAVRTLGEILVGVRPPASTRQLWLQLSSDSTYGFALAALWSKNLIRRPARPLPGADRGGPPPLWQAGQVDPEGAREIAQVLEYGPDVLAVAVLDANRQVESTTGRPSIDRARCEELVGRRAQLFAAAGACPTQGEGPRLKELGFSFRKVCTGEDDVWCFGAEIIGAGSRTLWVLTNRRATQGLGWGCLTALSRGFYRNWGLP